MPKQSAEETVPPRGRPRESAHQSGVGFQAVAAASLYCERHRKKPPQAQRWPAFRRDEQDYATD